MSSPVAEVVAALAAAFGSLGVDWYLFGAQAALLHGSQRMTHDVDVTVMPQGVDSKVLVAGLEEHGLSLRVPDADGFIAQTRVLPLVHDRTAMPVDVAIGGPGLEQLFLDGSETHEIDGTEVRVPKAEHIVVMKLLAGRPHDLDDAEAIGRRGALDFAEVEGLVGAIAEALGEDDVRGALAELRRRLVG